MEEKDLVYLVMKGNRTVWVEEQRPADIEVDFQKGEWSYKKPVFNHWEHGARKIGEACVWPEKLHDDQTVGVYDRTNVKHLDSMVHAAYRAREGDRHSFSED